MLEVGGQQIRLIDTPGLVWEADESATNIEVRTRDILLRNRGRLDRLKDPSMAGKFFLDFMAVPAYRHPQFPSSSVGLAPKT
jgi:hypothetical protein